jgi:hypothetical protein
MATIDYMVAAYGPFSASATGGNALARDVLAGLAAFYSVPCRLSSLSSFLSSPANGECPPVFHHFDAPNTFTYPSTILACIAIFVTIPIYIFYYKGPSIRARSHFAQEIESHRQADGIMEMDEVKGNGTASTVALV